MSEHVADDARRWEGPPAAAGQGLHWPGILIAATLFVLLDDGHCRERCAAAVVDGQRESAGGPGGGTEHPVALQPYVRERGADRAERREAAAEVALVYDPPDPNVSRTQSLLARQVLDYVRNVLGDGFGSAAQRAEDMQQITALTLSAEQIDRILNLSAEAWDSVDGEIINVLERIMREPIRETNLEVVRTQLPTQVSIRFSTAESGIIVAIVEDLLRPNTFPNEEATEAARQAAVDAVLPVERTFALNEVVVRQNEQITVVDMEAMRVLGLLGSRRAAAAGSGQGLFREPAGVVAGCAVHPALRAQPVEPREFCVAAGGAIPADAGRGATGAAGQHAGRAVSVSRRRRWRWCMSRFPRRALR